jgi:type IV pilus assembly protein PilW
MMKKNNGFSLVEMMVAMAIMLIVVGAVLAIYSSSRQTVRTQNEMSRINERVNSLQELVSRDLRGTGYAGCPNSGDSALGFVDARDDAVTALFPTQTGLMRNRANHFRVLAAGSPGVDAIAQAGSLVIEIRSASLLGTQVVDAMSTRPSPLTPIRLKSNPGFTVGAINPVTQVLVTDCKSIEHVPVSALLQTGTDFFLQPSGPMIIGFDQDARVHRIEVIQYYVGLYNSGPGATGRPTLAIYRRTALPGTTTFTPGVPVVHDVATLNIQLALDTNGDWDADQTVAASTAIDTTQVTAIQLNYTLREAEIGGMGSGKGTGASGALISRAYSPWITIRGRVI